MNTGSLRVAGLVVGLAALALGLVPDGLAAARSGARLTVSPRSGLAGRVVTARGYGFRPNARGIVLFGAKSVASFRAGGSGMFGAKFVVPPGASRRLRVVAG